MARFSLACLLALIAAAGCDDAKSRPKPGGDRGSASAQRVSAMTLHAAHARADTPVACSGCHDQVAGQYLQAESWRCENCHTSAPLELHAAAGERARECRACHDFTSTAADPTVPCASCHDMPRHAAGEKDDCGACHRAHERPSLAPTRCETCHDSTEVTGHDKPDIPITGCASCHGYHEKAATASTRCASCHRQSRALVSTAATFPGGHEKCATCHRPHRFLKAEVIGCRGECHAEVVALAEDRVAKHADCLACHDQHDVRASAQKACVTCHKIVPKHPADRASNTPCIGCHEPHAGRRAPVAVACSRCHTRAGSDRGFHQNGKRRGPACRDCHRPHEFDLRSAGTALCGRCHRAIRPIAKHADCFGCHQKTVAHQPTGPRVACASCHARQASIARAEHKTCAGCHDPHTAVQRTACSSCHPREAAAARSKHKQCVNCHEPHSARQKASCQSCHRAQARSAPTPHADCRQCHDPHSTRVVRACATCHAGRDTGIHAKVKGTCLSCHRAHGPGGHARPPACTTCHQRRALPALHQIKDHADCTACHRSHGTQPYRGRAACLVCHTDRKNHEPAATLCIGCHGFRGSQ